MREFPYCDSIFCEECRTGKFLEPVDEQWDAEHENPRLEDLDLPAVIPSVNQIHPLSILAELMPILTDEKAPLILLAERPAAAANRALARDPLLRLE